jgi:glycosyltransferase involved in cell wall biosynthesis
MKSIKALYHHLNTTKEFKYRYPNFNLTDKKVHVLFLMACTNEQGYYRMILPAMELNRTDTHAAIIAQIHKWNFNKQFDDYDTAIDFRLVEWADYIVVPALFSDINYIIKCMMEINSDVEFVMDVDLNYHELPPEHPDFKKFTPELKQILQNNLSQVDILSAPNNYVLSTYEKLAQGTEEELSLYFERYGSLLSNFTYEEIKHIERNSTQKVRIGLIAEASQGSDVKLLENVIKILLEKYPNKIEIVLFGWSKKIALQCGLFDKLNITYENPVPFQEFHLRLNALALDIGLLPFVNNLYNVSGKTLLRYLDFSGSMIPVVASQILPFTKIIEEGDNGFLASSEEDWVAKIEQLILNRELRVAVGSNAFKTVWEKFSYTPQAIERLKNIFI